MTKRLLTALLGGVSLLGTAGIALAADATLTIESWRNDDLSIWQEKLIPAFEAKNPGIKINFAPSAPTEYDAALGAKLQAGSAGDLITCRPFDKSLELYNKGNLTDLSALPGMEYFSDTAKAACSRPSSDSSSRGSRTASRHSCCQRGAGCKGAGCIGAGAAGIMADRFSLRLGPWPGTTARHSSPRSAVHRRKRGGPAPDPHLHLAGVSSWPAWA